MLDYLLIPISIFLLRFPTIYLGGSRVIFSTEILSLIVLGLYFIAIRKKLLSTHVLNLNKENFLILIFFFLQSLSVVGASNIGDFLQRYVKIIFGILIYISVKYYLSKNKNISYHYLLLALIFGSSITIAMQLLVFFSPTIYNDLGKLFIYSNEFNFVQVNSSVGKLLDGTYVETIIPILIFYLTIFRERKNQKIKLIIVSLISILGFIAVVSNFRYRVLAYIFAILLSFICFEYKKLSKFILFAVIIVAFITANIFSKNISGYTVFERVFTPEQGTADTTSVSFRIDMMIESAKLAFAYPITGVGLGNFYNALPNKYKSQLILRDNVGNQIYLGALQAGSHNIFFQFLAETGILGVLSFILLILFFVKKDIALVKSNVKYKKPFIASFWTLMIIVQFFPPTNLAFYTLFFLLRAAI